MEYIGVNENKIGGARWKVVASRRFTTLSEELADEKIKAVKAYPRTTEDLIFNDEGATGFAKRFVELSIGVRGGQE